MPVNLESFNYGYANPVNYGKYPSNVQIVVQKVEVPETEGDSFLSNGCSDGKDDGKIGLLNIAGHVAKGALNTAGDIAKSCVTDSEGNFSLGKTALTAATVGLCAAFSPLALLAGGVGAVIGAVKVGQGISNLAAAKTDAQAKKACQDIGGGALIGGTSAVGAKASLGAVRGNALGALGENASLAEKAVALAKDSKSSIVNSGKEYAQTAGLVKDTAVAGAKSLFGNIKSAVLNPKQTANGIYQPLKSGVTSAYNSAKEVAKHPIDTAKDAFASAKGVYDSVSFSDIKSSVVANAKSAANVVAEKLASDEAKLTGGVIASSQSV